MSSLYLEHFRLGEAPFGITPNGKFFFEGQARGAILDALHHAVLDEDGIVVVVGEVGSGKTMLCRMLADRLPRDQSIWSIWPTPRSVRVKSCNP